MSSNLDPYQSLIKDEPQDPFLPREDSYGPSFLDTGACLCSLRSTGPEGGDDTDSTDGSQDSVDAGNTDGKRSRSSRITERDSTVAWQCIGNQTQGVYTVTTGKWFNPVSKGGNANGPIYAGSNGPELANALQWNSTSNSLVVADESELTAWDRACTGVNETTFSTAFYRAFAEQNASQTPVDGAPCWYAGAIPIGIQNLTSWQSDGCPQGFLCANNTVNSLPQYCPPLTECQELRVTGKVCTFEGKNIGMGPFEPVICQQGYYCPPEKNGIESLPCPAGSYCLPGAATPTPCSTGSHCPAKSGYERYLVPLLLVIVLDTLIAVGLLWYTAKKRFHSHRSSHVQSKPKGITAISRAMTGYKELPDETEHEMMPMEATYMPRSDGFNGFHAALDMPGPNRSKTRLEDFEGGFSPQLRAFIESMRKATDATHFGLSFTYSDLSFQPKGVARPILQNVTGSIQSGSLTAIMGGSGAGKSTFVNVLMGKANHTGGSVTVNNVPGKINRFKKLIGYVPQDDIVLPELTVYENILHSARIRLPRNWADVDIKAHVNSVVDCLELSHVRDSLVGSVGKPVISGGQRKRVSIGMELAAAPMAIFLDEPTSGLDATSASSIMLTLKAIARLGISVIVIIHQPRMEIFERLDDLILLGNGQIIYEGREKDVRPFFEDFGYHFPEHSNWGDVVTDIITGNGGSYKKRGNTSKEVLVEHWAASRQSAQIKNKHESSQNSRASLIELSTIQHELLKHRGAPRAKQAWLCLKRAMLQQWRSRTAFLFEMGLAVISGLLLGLANSAKSGVLFTGIYNAPFEILSTAIDVTSVPELALLTAIAIGLVSGAPGVRVFSEEMLLYRREAEAGHSRIAYFLAKTVSVVPRMLFACLHFTTVILLLAVPVMGWGIAFLANLLYFYCIYGLASAVSMVTRREDAPLIATMISLIAGILSGASPTLAKVASWHLEWLWRASPGTWLAELYFGQNIERFEYLYNVEQAAEVSGFHLHWLWRNMAVLLGIGTIYRVLAFIGLTAGNRLRV
ncbi:hypothetical protein GGR56DRAFT_393755 [Xylariaceae sp. FL0804]|nr:hypothetical protein GGR56DRAFT_393755 [Xylariaceae sp. FL0804]